MGRQSKIRKLRREGKLPRVEKERNTPVWVKVLVSILIAVLVLGSASAVWGYAERNVAAKVGRETITIDQVNNQLDYYRNLYSQFGMTLTAQQEEQLKQNILQNLIEESLLVQYAKDHNLKYDEAQYKKNLQDQIDQTIEQGKKNNGEKTFLDLVNGQYGSLDAYKQYLEKVYGPYVERPLLAQAALDEKYKDIKVTDEEVKQYFNSVKEISAEHLLVLLPENPSSSEVNNAKKLAEEIYKEINEKKSQDKNFNFATYAQAKVKEVNEKNNGKEVLKYENLGYFPKGQMVKEFEDAVFDTKVNVGDIIGPVKTQYGFHIIHILGKKTVAETYDEPEKVNVRIVQFNFDPKDAKSKENAFTSARSISIQTKNGMSFIDAVKRFSQDETTKKNNGETGFFSRDEKPEIFDAVVKLNKGGITNEPILVGNSYVVAQLIDKKPAKKATLDDKDIYNKVKEELINNKKEEIKKQFVEELKKTYHVRTTNPGRILANFFRKYIATPFNNFNNWISNISKPANNTNQQNQNNTSTQPLEPVNPSSGS
jgi:peptidyl-prolyl cis-trans isomerase SurA